MSDDGTVVAFFGLVVVGGVYALAQAIKGGADGMRRAQAARLEHEERARLHVEHRMLELLKEFPALDEHGLARLMHDELMNQRLATVDYLRWATPDTAGRIIRTVVVEIERASRREAEKASAVVLTERAAPVFRICPDCNRSTRVGTTCACGRQVA